MPSKPSPTLNELLEQLAAETPDVAVRGGEHVRKGVAFAARLEPNAIELRLGPEIADAAMRTPQTSASSRGADWVRLSPNNWADASDRLEAWYRVAWRIAAKNKR